MNPRQGARSGLSALLMIVLPLLIGCTGDQGRASAPAGNATMAAPPPASAGASNQAPAARSGIAAPVAPLPGSTVYASKLSPDQAGSPISLRDAYPDYHPGADDPELESTKTGRRVVALHDRILSEGGAESLQGLISQILTALDAADGRAPRRLCVTRQDFASILWPEMPQSRPAAGVPEVEAWDFLDNRNMAAFNRNMGAYHGSGLALRSFQVGKSEDYTNFRLLDGISVEAVKADGQPVTLDMIRTVVERKGRFKLYSTRD